MPYLISLFTVTAATVVLLVVLASLGGSARRLAGVARLHRARIADHSALLRARIAGLRAEMERRRPPPVRRSSGPPAA